MASNLAAAQTQYPIIVGEFSLGTYTYCVDYQTCFGETLDASMANLTDYETSLFLRQFWEVQSDVYELAAGWIFWSFSNELGAPWSWSQSAAQNWIPEDPTEKIWPYYANASSFCLDTSNPIAGDQNLPSFPSYANNISNIDIALVKAKNQVVSATNLTETNSTAVNSSSSPASSPTGLSSTIQTTSVSATSASAADRAAGVRATSGIMGVLALLGTTIALVAVQ